MIVHLMIPGLTRAHVENERIDFGDAPPTVVADLTCTFPVSIEAVEATLLTGVAPAVHARWRSTDPLRAPLLDDPAVVHRRDDRVARARIDAPDDRAMLRRALDDVGALIATAREESRHVLVTSGPPHAATPQRIDWPEGIALEPLGGAAVSLAPLDAADRARLLRTSGVARVLDGDGLRSWHGPPVAAVVLAEPGWTFDAGAAACGRRDLDGTEDGAVVLAWGPPPDAWPRAVHDLRVGPTLAAHAGVALADAVDRPLRWPA